MDVLPDAYFAPLQVRREVNALTQRFGVFFDSAETISEEGLIAFTAAAFLAMCIGQGLDTQKTLAQIDRLIQADAFHLDDDPARGRFVHAPGRA